MKIKIELKYKKTTPRGAVYGLKMDGLANQPELVFPQKLGDFAEGSIELSEEKPDKAPAKKGKK